MDPLHGPASGSSLHTSAEIRLIIIIIIVGSKSLLGRYVHNHCVSPYIDISTITL